MTRHPTADGVNRFRRRFLYGDETQLVSAEEMLSMSQHFRECRNCFRKAYNEEDVLEVLEMVMTQARSVEQSEAALESIEGEDYLIDDHLDDEQIADYVNGKLDAWETAAADEHTSECELCLYGMKLVEKNRRLRDTQTPAPDDEDVTDHLSEVELRNYVDETVNEADWQIINSHVCDCDECTERVIAGNTVRMARRIDAEPEYKAMAEQFLGTVFDPEYEVEIYATEAQSHNVVTAAVLSSYTGNELSEAGRDAVLSHLRWCEDCGTEVRMMHRARKIEYPR